MCLADNLEYVSYESPGDPFGKLCLGELSTNSLKWGKLEDCTVGQVGIFLIWYCLIDYSWKNSPKASFHGNA
jgi:hypothetical protein